MDKAFKYSHLCQDATAKYIAQGALTNSKRASCFVEGVYPQHFEKGNQEYLFDIEGKRYLDFLCGLGTNLFGYAHPEINRAMNAAMVKGTSLSLGTPIENEFAMKIPNKFPHIDKIKILKSGSEGCSAAVRIARAYTQKRKILSEGYHGWHDQFVSLTPPAIGVPDNEGFCIQSISESTFDKFEYRNTFTDVAAIILEPVILDYTTKRHNFLKRLRKLCTQYEILLIFDETITAYRFPQYSVASHWGIDPDITIQGKALANGMPISVVGGKAEIMDADYFVSTTYAGEQLTLAAALECIKLVSNDFNPERLWESGSEFIDRMNEPLGKLNCQLTGYPTRGGFGGNATIIALWCQEMLKAGVFFHPQTWFYNRHLHTHIDDIVDLNSKIVKKIISGGCRLEGEFPIIPFKKG